MNFSIWYCTLEQTLIYLIVFLNTLLSSEPKGYETNQFCSNNFPLFYDDKHKYLRIMVNDLINWLTAEFEVCRFPLSLIVNRVRFVSFS